MTMLTGGIPHLLKRLADAEVAIEIDKVLADAKVLGIFAYYSFDDKAGMWRATVVPGNDVFYHGANKSLGKACAEALEQYYHDD